jgi:hypothetical protein
MIKPLVDIQPNPPVGKIKTFGPLGPKYEIKGRGRLASNNDWLVPIRLVDSGEETEYSYARLQQDPDAS